jgi:hypothetical protein
MDSEQFDRLTRTLGNRASRREALRRWGVAGLVAGLVGANLTRPAAVTAHHCLGEGCGCRQDANHPCDIGLVCCGEPGYPDGTGVCMTQYNCTGYGLPGDDCPRYCLPGPVECPSCISGYCTRDGYCA